MNCFEFFIGYALFISIWTYLFTIEFDYITSHEISQIRCLAIQPWLIFQTLIIVLTIRIVFGFSNILISRLRTWDSNDFNFILFDSLYLINSQIIVFLSVVACAAFYKNLTKIPNDVDKRIILSINIVICYLVLLYSIIRIQRQEC